MGRKGDKLTQDSVLVAELMLDRLSSIGGITSKKMFGGHGIFHEGKMFGIIDSAGLSFMKADDGSRADYEGRGSTKHSRMPYFSIPEDVFQNPDIFVEWANKAIACSK